MSHTFMKLPSSPETTYSKPLLYSTKATGYSCDVFISSYVLNYKHSYYLSAYKPEVDFSGAQQDVVGAFVEMKEGESVFRSVADLVKDGLDADISPDVPDLYDLVRAQGDKMVTVLIYCQVLHTCVVTI